MQYSRNIGRWYQHLPDRSPHVSFKRCESSAILRREEQVNRVGQSGRSVKSRLQTDGAQFPCRMLGWLVLLVFAGGGDIGHQGKGA